MPKRTEVNLTIHVVAHRREAGFCFREHADRHGPRWKHNMGQLTATDGERVIWWKPLSDDLHTRLQGIRAVVTIHDDAHREMFGTNNYMGLRDIVQNMNSRYVHK